MRLIVAAFTWTVLGAAVCAAASAQERPGPLSTSPASARSTAAGWVPLRSSRIARTEVAAAAVGRSIYVIGGFASAGTPTREVERYDTDRDHWEVVEPMPIAVNHAAAVGHRGDLYVLGGYTGAPFSLGIGTGGVADATSAFFRYEPETDSWSQMPPAPSRRAAMAAAVIGDQLYVAGGADSLRALTTFEVFDFERRTWRRGPEMPLPTEHAAGAAAGGAFYVVSGRPAYGAETNRFVQRYRPATEQWDRIADLTSGRGGLAAVAACDRVVAFGGEDPRRGPPGTVPEVERYHPSRNVWERLPDMTTPRHGLGGAAIGGRLYALEGGDVTFLSVTSTAEALDVPCVRPPGESVGEQETQPPPDDVRGTAGERSAGARQRTGRPPTPGRPGARTEATDSFLPLTGTQLAPPVVCAIGLLLGGVALRRRLAAHPRNDRKR